MTISDLRTLVVCYHSVSEDWPNTLAVKPRAFQRQLSEFRRRRLRPLSADDLVAGVTGGIHVTFDDAYRAVLAALPAVERAGLHATVFASTSFADDGRPLAVPELADDAAAYPEQMATMTWDELRATAERGVEIGSHTVNHPHLPRLSDAELDSELADSRARIEDELGRICRLLAYPYGEHDERVQAAAARAGYAAAFALWGGAATTNRFALPRVGVWRRDSLLRVGLKTSGLRPLAQAVLERFRGVPS